MADLHVGVGQTYTTIQDALNAAALSGDTVVVHAGTYAENIVISKSVNLFSVDGPAATSITGSGTGGNTIQIANNTSDVVIGGPGVGFTIVGTTSANDGLETAAVYLSGTVNNVEIRNNIILANGEAALISEWQQGVTNITVDGNTIGGNSYDGAAPLPVGHTVSPTNPGGFTTSPNQWNSDNVARQLVTLGQGYSGGSNAANQGDNIVFTNNIITGKSGVGSVGTGLVNIEADNSTVSGNIFDNTSATASFELRVRGEDSDVTDNQMQGLKTIYVTNEIGDISGNTAAGDPIGVTFLGTSGNDTFVGTSGNDKFDGQAGSDTVDYSATTGGVVISTNTAFAVDPGVDNIGTDELSSIENAIGGSGNDTFVGESGVANSFIGGAGNDIFNAGTGAGVDRFVYQAAMAADGIATKGTNRLFVNGGAEGTDDLRNVEEIQFADGKIIKVVNNNAAVYAGTDTQSVIDTDGVNAGAVINGSGLLSNDINLDQGGIDLKAVVAATVEGTYGTLVLDSLGNYTYTLKAAVDGLSADTTETLNYSVTDGTNVTTASLVINLTAANDKPIITGTVAANAFEGGSLDQTIMGTRFYPTVDLDDEIDALVTANGANMAQTLLDVETLLGPDADKADAIAHVWNRLDEHYVEDGVVGGTAWTNEAVARLSIEYARYVAEQDGAPLTHIIAKDAPAGRQQSLHDNLLGNLSNAALDQRWVTPTGYPANPTLRAEFQATLSDPDLSYVLTRTYVSGNAGTQATRDAVWALDRANGFQPAYSGQLTATDAEGTALTWSAGTQLGMYGSLELDANGKWTYTLDNSDADTQALYEGEVVTDTFTVQVTDAGGAIGEETVTVTITGTNDAPVINAALDGASFDIDEGESLSATTGEVATIISDYIADVEGDAVTVTLTLNYGPGPDGLTPTSQTITVAPGGTFSYTPPYADYFGTVTVGVLATDALGATDTSSFTLNIENINDAPFAAADLVTGSAYAKPPLAAVREANVGPQFNFQESYDLDPALRNAVNLLPGDPDNFDIVFADAKAALGSEADVFALLWDVLDAGYTSYTNTDVNTGFVLLGIEYAKYLLAGGAPLTGVVAKFSATRNQSMHDNLLGNFSAAYEDPARFTVDQRAMLDARIALEGLGDLHDRPYYSGDTTQAAGTPEALAAAREFDIAELNLPYASGQLEATDADYDSLTWAIQGETPVGNVTSLEGIYGTLTVNTDGTWSYVLNETDPDTVGLAGGADALEQDFIVEVSDGNGGTDTTTIRVTVNGTNQAPVLGFDQDFSANTNGINTGGGYGAITRVASGAYGTDYALVTEAGSGPFTRFGAYTSEFVDEAQTSVRVYLDTSWDLNEGFQYTVAANGSDGAHQRDFAFGVRSLGNGILEVSTATGATQAAINYSRPGSFEVSASGWYTLEHVFNDEAGVLSVDLILRDGNGLVVNTWTISEAADVIGTEVGGTRYGWFTDISIDGGLAVDDFQRGDLAGGVTEDASTVTTSGVIPFSDLDLADTHNVDITPAASSGYFGIFSYALDDSNGDGFGALTWTFTGTASELDGLAEGEVVTQTYTITISDGNGGSASRDVTVTITGTNDAPTIAAIAPVDATEDTDETISALDVQALIDQYIDDVDGDALTVSLSIDFGGTVVNYGVVDPLQPFVFSPPLNFNGAATATVTVDDGMATPVTADFTINVEAVNDAPTVAAIAPVDATEDTDETISALDVQALIDQYIDDVDGDVLTVSLSIDFGGTVVNYGVVNPSQPFVFSPPLNFNGAATATVTVEDGTAAPVSADFTINVEAVNDAPTIAPIAPVDATEDTDETIPALDVQALIDQYIDDVDGDALTVSLSIDFGGTVVNYGVVNPSQPFVFSPPLNFNGAATATVTVEDGTAAPVSADFTINVAPVNDAPDGDLTGALAGGTEDTDYVIDSADLLDGISDVDGDTLSVTDLVASSGTLVDNGDGTYTLTPDSDSTDTVTLTYTVSDGNGEEIEVTRTVAFAPVNDAPRFNPLSYSISENDVHSFDLRTNAYDIDGNPPMTAQNRTVLVDDVVVSAGINGPVVFTGNNIATVNPLYFQYLGTGETAKLEIEYEVRDQQGSVSEMRTVEITVNGSNETVNGNAGDNTLNGGQYADDINGNDGDDIINGLGGDDIVHGNDGDDSINAGSGDDYAYGDDGDDTISGGSGNDHLFGGEGDDVINGNSGNDTISGGLGKDRLAGGSGVDTFVVDSAADSVAGAPRDVISDFQIDEKLDLSAMGSFNFIGMGTPDRIVADGQVKFYFYLGNTYIVGRTTGPDAATFQLELTGDHELTTANFVGLANVGDATANTLVGTNGADWIYGLDGEDNLVGGLGKDTLTGGADADVFVYNSAAESGAGAAARDFIADFVQGVDKIDLSALDANSTMGGTQGFGFVGQGPATLDAAAGHLKYYHANGNTYVTGGIDGVAGADFQIEIKGTVFLTADDFIGLASSNGPDNLVGTAANETLSGLGGDDFLTGLGGKDTLYGGLDNDTFVYTSTADSIATAADRDVIADWNAGDKIDLSQIDAAAGGADDAFLFGGSFTGISTNVQAGHVRVFENGGNTYVIASADGDNVREFQIEILGINHNLTASDFVL